MINHSVPPVGGHKSDAPPVLPASASAFERARSRFPGGTTRATIASDPHPVYIERGEGPWLIDIDGNRYLDLNNNFTTLVHGHAFAPVVDVLAQQLQAGTCFANPTLSEIDLADLICGRVPCIDRIRFVNTGTEAVMFAIKAARAYTGKSKVAKFEGAYHGGYDWAEVSEGSTPDNWGANNPVSVPYYKGTPQSVLDEVVVLPMNDVDRTRDILVANANDLACVLIDLMPSRAGLVPVSSPYLAMLREFTSQRGIVLISDEVLNFRQSFEGAAARFGVTPDLVALGKIIGGGLPIGAVAGREKFMAVFGGGGDRPAVPQGGTFSANPLSMVAGTASMRALDKAAFAHLEHLGERLRRDLAAVFDETGVPMSVSGQASLFRIHPRHVPPRCYREAYATKEQEQLMRSLCRHLSTSGINLPSHGTGSLSTTMATDDIQRVVDVVREFALDGARA